MKKILMLVLMVPFALTLCSSSVYAIDSTQQGSRLQQLGQQYGGSSAGSGIPSAPDTQSARGGVYFDTKTNQHYTIDANGQRHTFEPATGNWFKKNWHWLAGVVGLAIFAGLYLQLLAINKKLSSRKT